MKSLLKRMGTAGLAFLLVFMLLPVVSIPVLAADTENVKVEVTYNQTAARQMLDYINKFRAGEDVDGQKADYLNPDNTTKTDLTGTLSPLTYDYSLERTAMQRAAEIALSFDHTRPNGGDCFDAWEGVWYGKGENIAAGYSSAYNTFVQWREDNEMFEGQGHRRNMLYSGFTKIGIGHVVFNGYHFWTQAFGTGDGDGTQTVANDSVAVVPVEVAVADIQNLKVTVSPENCTLKTGESSALPVVSASFHMPESFPGNDYSVQVSPEWSSADASVASVGDGKVTGIAAGDTALKAQAFGREVSVSVHVAENGGSQEDPETNPEDFQYRVLDNGTVEITGYKGEDKAIVIPKTIDGKQVTSIGDRAFAHYEAMESLVIPEGITHLGELAFWLCTNLKAAVIPKSVATIVKNPFYACQSLESISVDPENPVYDSRNGANAIMETASNTLISGCGNTVIPDATEKIGEGAFAGMRSLTSVSIPANVKEIGESAFYSSGLTALVIPEGVKTVGYNAFYGCPDLVSVKIPASVTELDDYMFTDCSKLESIVVAAGNPKYDSRDNCNAIIETATNTLLAGSAKTVIPDTVTEIEKNAFRGRSITYAKIPSGVKALKSCVFSGCSKLTGLEIPKSVTVIEDSAIHLCGALETIIYGGSEEEWKSIRVGSYNEGLDQATIQYKDHGGDEPVQTLTKHAEKAPTCVDDGNKEYWTNDETGQIFADEAGTEELSEIPVIKALGHSWDSGIVTKAATALSAGVMTFTCTRCGETKTETIKKLTPTIKLSATKKAVKARKSFTLKISGLAKGDSVKSVKSGNTKIARVKKTGTNKYKITGVKRGKAVITVTLKSGKKAKCTVTVK